MPWMGIVSSDLQTKTSSPYMTLNELEVPFLFSFLFLIFLVECQASWLYTSLYNSASSILGPALSSLAVLQHPPSTCINSSLLSACDRRDQPCPISAWWSFCRLTFLYIYWWLIFLEYTIYVCRNVLVSARTLFRLEHALHLNTRQLKLPYFFNLLVILMWNTKW